MNSPNRIQLKRLTSDEYFEEFDPTEWLGGPVELAFIDGMHLIEFALRDFINTEKYCSPNSVIIFDDILPQNIDWAARERFTQFWTGDVFKIIELLKNYRPDLTLTILDTEPTGLLLVTGLDPHSTTLSEEFDDIIKHFLTPDPQSVPTEILQRHEAQSVSSVLDTKDVFSPNKKVEANAIETSCILGRLRRLFGK